MTNGFHNPIGAFRRKAVYNNEKLTEYVNRTYASELKNIGGINGQKHIAVYSSYVNNEYVECVFGKNMSWDFGMTITFDGENIILAMPDGSIYNFALKYNNSDTGSGELTDGQVTQNVNEKLINGYKPVSRGSNKFTLSDTESGYVVETGNHTKYYFDKTGKMIAHEDKTGYRVDIARTDNTITVTEKNTGKSMTANLNVDGHITNLTSDKGTYSFSYDENGNLTQITDPMGAKTNYEYTNDRLTKRVDENAENVKTTVFENAFDDEGRLISQTDGKGNSRTYTYNTDEYWRIKVVEKDRMGYNWNKEFNRFDELVKAVDPKGNEVMYTYDGNGNLASVIKSAENTVTYIYDDKDNLLSFTDQNDVTTSYDYDDKSNLIKTTLPNGAVITNTYDSNNRLKTQTDERNTVTEYTYDNDGNTTSVKITPSEGTPITASYVYTDSKMTSSTDFNGSKTDYTYNADGNITSVTDALNNTTSYEYDEDKRLVKVTYPSGHTEKYTYDNKGNVLTYTDKNGNVTTNVYDANNNLFTTSKGSALTTFTYDKEDRVLKAEDNTGAVEYVYDSVGNVVSEKDKNGNVAAYAYDNFNRLVQQTIGGATTKYTLDYTDRLVGITDPYNNVTAYTYDNMGNLTEVTNSLGNKTAMIYDASGNMLTVKTPLGNTYSYTYDFRGNKVTEKDAKSYTTAYEYDNNGNLTKVTDPMGGVTEYTYDALNRQASVKNANGNVTTYAYDDVNSASSITLPTSQVYSYTYDGNGNVLTANEGSGLVTATYDYNNKPLTITDALNNKVEYTYDALGNPLTYKTARGNTYTYAYDGNGNLKTETDPLNGVVTYNYNEYDTVTSFKDANNNNTAYEYDLLNRLVSETSATGSSDSYEYDALSRLTKYVNKRGQSINYVYDAEGKMTGRRTVEDVVLYTYDANGNLLTIEDKNGTIARTYDNLNRVKSYTNANNQTIGYEYDSVGNLTKLTYPDGKEVTYTYNSMNQMTSVTDWNNRVTSYTYDNNGRLKSISRPDGSIETYTYNAIGQLTNAVDKTADGTIINEYSYVYDADGNIITENSANEPAVSDFGIDSADMGYGPANQLNSFNGMPISYDADGDIVGKATVEGGTVYTYDGNGNILTITDENGTISRIYDSLNRITSYTDANDNTIQYEYDSVGNLAKLIYPDNKIVRYSYNANNQLAKVQDWANRITIYTYDNNGRLSSETRPDGSTQVYTYNANGQLTQTVDKTAEGLIINEYSYEYDADGNVITENSANEPNANSIAIPDRDMTYSSANRLTVFNNTAISYDADGNMLNTPLGDKWGALTYNSLNQLTDVTTSSGAITYVYDAESNRTLKTENGISTTYVTNPNAALSQVLMSTKNGETTYYIYGLGLIGQENYEGYKTYHYDYRGSTTAITDINGNVTDRIYYDPYGSIISRTGTTDTPFLYVGQYGVETDDSGLYYMRARYYNPQIQRFVNIDPVRDNNNWYAYTNGNTISNIDPTGYLDWSTQADDLWWGAYAKMEEFQYSVVSTVGDFIMDPKGEIIEAKNNIVQDISDTITGIKNGDITFGSIAKGAWDSGVQTAKNVGKGVYQLLPGIEVSDAEAYMLGYNIEGAALDTSVGIVSAYVGGKVGQAITKVVAPKVKAVASNIAGKLTSKKAVSKLDLVDDIVDGACFVEGTLIAVSNGYKSIEKIEVGDYVWAENPKTGELSLKKVVNTYVRTKTELVVIYVGSEVIETTEEHPFYVDGKGWITAGNLKIGDTLRLLNGNNVKIDSIEVQKLDEKIRVYNFEVKDFHTYFVGKTGVLVHNSCYVKGRIKNNVLDNLIDGSTMPTMPTTDCFPRAI